jgi:hypothetical protein
LAASVLYFPYISVPDEAWFTRVLLYWDRIGSIVPEQYANEPSRFTPFMRELVEAELVAPIEPDRHVGELLGPVEAFFRFVERDREIAARRRRWHDRPAPRGEAPAGTMSHLHRGKLGHMVADELEARGLARRTDREWYAVESRTAAAYMCFLAGALGRLPEVGMDPITDGIDALSPLASNGGSGLDALRRLRAPVLEELLPAPEGRVDVTELARFKEAHADELRRFRRAVEGALIDVAAIADPDLQAAKAELVRRELADGVEELRARMSERRWPRIVFGTICGVLAATVPGAQALAGGSVVAAGLAVPSAASGLYALLAGGRREPAGPLAYAALAQERLGV